MTTKKVPVRVTARIASYCSLSVSAAQRYRTSRPVTALPISIRWISDVRSKIVKILASRCQRNRN